MTRLFEQPFRLGDVVFLSEENEQHIICEAQINGDTYEYSTNIGAWYDHDQFVLVRECDKASIQQLRDETEDE
jgi:hypothetical protein